MSVKKPESDTTALPVDGLSNHDTPTSSKYVTPKTSGPTEHDVEGLPSYPTETIDYSNGKIVAGIGYTVWVVVIVANLYVIVVLAMGNSG